MTPRRDDILTVAITGGPCAGKSKIIARLPERIGRETGWHVITVPETVAWMGEHGMRRQDFPDALAFQAAQTRMQASHEDDAIAAAAMMPHAHVLVLMDRGIPDAAAYLDASEYERVLSGTGLSRQDALLRYDAVVFLHSIACGHRDAYVSHMNGNPMRLERDASAAAIADARTLAAYERHPRLVEVGDTDTIGEKSDVVMGAIASLVGEAHT